MSSNPKLCSCGRKPKQTSFIVNGVRLHQLVCKCGRASEAEETAALAVYRWNRTMEATNER